MEKIDVIIVDDHTLIRKGLENLIKTFKRIGDVKEAKDGEELFTLLLRYSPNVVLVDISMPVMDGFEIIEIIVSKYPEIKIIVVTMYNDERYVTRMLELGVHAYLTKDVDSDEFEKAIYSVVDFGFYQNDLVFPVLRKMLQNRLSRIEKREITSLTCRETEILSLICKEFSYKEISDQLNISEKTIHNHRNNIMEKIGAKNTISLIKYAYENGFMTLSLEGEQKTRSYINSQQKN